MSALIPHCDDCNLDRIFIRIAGLGNQTTYGVEWRCPRCDGHVLDLCPVGPLAPTGKSCLNCGVEFPELDDFAACPACGVTRLGARDLFGLDPAPADPVDLAGKLFDLGLIRRALATLNQALVRDPSLEPAWRVKYAFLSGLGFSQAALVVIEATIDHIVNPDLLISYAHLLQTLGHAKHAREVYHEYLVTAPAGEYADAAKQAIKTLDEARR